MEGYIFEAAFWCQECTTEIKLDLEPIAEDDRDSSVWPQGPYDMAREESDSPDHCDRCQKFLENPLTSDGEAYVKEALLTQDIPEWGEFYSYLWESKPSSDELPEGSLGQYYS